MGNRWIFGCLTATPAGDVNFRSALERARSPTLYRTLAWLKEHPAGNGSRITAILRELRRREKQVAHRMRKEN